MRNYYYPLLSVTGEVEALPLNSVFNLNALKSRTAIGLVKMATSRVTDNG